MKYLKSYKTKEEYINDIRGGDNTHSLPNVALIEEENEKPYYDIERMSDNKSKDIWDRIKEKGWNYNTTSAITTQELALVTSDEFNSLNEVEPTNMPGKVWKGLKTFDEFKYFTGVDNINAASKSSSGNRVGGFNAAKELESITLPSSLKEIGYFAFNMYGHSGNTTNTNTKLKHIYGSENVERIGAYAFQNCSALTEFNFSSKLKEIEYGAFSFCYSLQKAIVPDTITVIHIGTFGDNVNLTNIGNMHNVKYIGDHAFNGWDGDPANRLGTNTGMLNYDGSFDGQMPNLEEIGKYAFQRQVYLKELYMPKLKSIWDCCFFGCTNLKKITTSNCVRICNSFNSGNISVNGIEYDTVPNNCIIKDKVKMPISSITDWTFSDNETRIPSFFLYNATNLSSVAIPNSITSIGRAVFNNCSKLETINGSNTFIGNGTTDIAYLFNGCKKLKELDLSNCDFSGIVNYGETAAANSGLYHFATNCSSLATLKLGKFNISGFTNGTNYNLFDGDTSLKDIYITSDSPSLSFLESQCVISKIASNVTIHFGEELYTYNGSSWVKS